jgi:ketosteroid isomerase-like protein
MNAEAAQHFAEEWIEAWNTHDLDKILKHYSDDFEMSSPFIVQFSGERSGTLKGKRAIGNYWRSALSAIPDLRFELVDVLVGVNSVVLYYNGHRGKVAEVFHFGSDGLVSAAFANYTALNNS